MNGSLIRKAMKETLPVFFGYMAIGIAFGLMVVNAGYPWWLAPLMGVTMYTGAGQFFAIGLFAVGAALPEILLAEFLLSIRHIFYGLSLIGKYRNLGKYRPYLIYAITDETFALIQSDGVPENTDPGLYYTLISAFDQSYWLLGGIIGAVAYDVLQHYNLSQYLQGIDFALTALFTVLLVEQLKKKENLLPACIGIAVTAVAVFLFQKQLFASSNIIWISICFGLAVMLLIKGPSFFKNYRESDYEGSSPADCKTDASKNQNVKKDEKTGGETI